jgi:hypothetical protein
MRMPPASHDSCCAKRLNWRSRTALHKLSRPRPKQSSMAKVRVQSKRKRSFRQETDLAITRLRRVLWRLEDSSPRQARAGRRPSFRHGLVRRGAQSALTAVGDARRVALFGRHHGVEVVFDDLHRHGRRDRAAVATVLDEHRKGDARLGRGREAGEPGVVHALVGQRRLVASAAAALEDLGRPGLARDLDALGTRLVGRALGIEDHAVERAAQERHGFGRNRNLAPHARRELLDDLARRRFDPVNDLRQPQFSVGGNGGVEQTPSAGR